MTSSPIPIPLVATDLYTRAYNLAFDHAKRRDRETCTEPWPLSAEDRRYATIVWVPDGGTYQIQLRSHTALVATINYDPGKNRLRFLGFPPAETSS